MRSTRASESRTSLYRTSHQRKLMSRGRRNVPPPQYHIHHHHLHGLHDRVISSVSTAMAVMMTVVSGGKMAPKLLWRNMVCGENPTRIIPTCTTTTTTTNTSSFPYFMTGDPARALPCWGLESEAEHIRRGLGRPP